MSRPALLALLLLLPAAVVGCIEIPDGATEAARQTNVEERYLTDGLGFSEAPPRDGAVRTGAFFQRWAEGDDYATWTGDLAPHDRMIQDIEVRLVLRATGPVVESSRFPDIMVYAGAGEAFLGYGDVRDEQVLVPMLTYHVDVEVEVPEGGLWLPAGEPFALKVVPVMLQQDDAADIEVVTGPAGSRVEWHEAPLDTSPRPPLTGEAEGEAIGSAYAGDAAPKSTSQSYPIQVPAGAQAVLAWMNVTGSDGIPDVDLEILGPDGETVAFSGTPTPREALKLAAPNLRGPGEYRLVVTSYGSARAAFTLAWAIG